MPPLIDTNVSLGFWPFQPFAIRTPGALAAHIRRLQIDFALVSAIESILFEDPDFYDRRCFNSLKKYPNLRPVKTLNPTLNNWQASFQSFLETYPLAAVKLYPNYHSYSLTDPCVAALCQTAAAQQLPILVPLRVEDERQHHACMSVPSVPMTDLITLAQSQPHTHFVALNTYIWEATSIPLKQDNLYSDFAFCETPDVLQAMIENFPPARLVFGSATPFLTTESALAKLQNGTVGQTVQAIIRNNLSRDLKFPDRL